MFPRSTYSVPTPRRRWSRHVHARLLLASTPASSRPRAYVQPIARLRPFCPRLRPFVILLCIPAARLQWSPLMYSMIDAEYFVSCFFFIVTIVVLNFWLLNLFVAVITNTFSAIREETHKSAFGAAPYVFPSYLCSL